MKNLFVGVVLSVLVLTGCKKDTSTPKGLVTFEIRGYGKVSDSKEFIATAQFVDGVNVLSSLDESGIATMYYGPWGIDSISTNKPFKIRQLTITDSASLTATLSYELAPGDIYYASLPHIRNSHLDSIVYTYIFDERVVEMSYTPNYVYKKNQSNQTHNFISFEMK